MNAKDLKRALHRQTKCSSSKIILQDKIYDTVSTAYIQHFVLEYEQDEYIPEQWDCDDQARDFWNYAKKRIKSEQDYNAIMGMLILPAHTKLLFATAVPNTDEIAVKYLDQNGWRITNPNQKPKWIVL